MAKVMKSFRLSESAIAALENRDTQKYRSGQEYIEKSEPTIETVLEELKKLNEKIEKILSEQLQEKSESNEKKEIPKMYGGLPYTPPPSDII